MSALVAIGAIEGAFGVHGELRVKSFTADPEAITAYGPLLDADGAVVLTPHALRPIKGGFALSAPEVQTREQADALRNTLLHVPRERLPAPEEDEFYHVDLIGCRVQTPSGDALGNVRAVHDFGAGDLLEIVASGRPSVFLPLTKAVIPTIDLAARRIIAIPPDEDE
ncbi:MAG: 16S rRNA processing protein RimM [Alphaproteobacteria bacterium]|nr:16S rRNA processing protein RimM [Alphaproteobacteria bacterium]